MTWNFKSQAEASRASERGLVHAGRSGGRRGFTLIESLIATGLLGFSLIVMFGFHSQAVRSNNVQNRVV